MIVSYEHNLIFIKPRKVAGTSFEIALRALTGPSDIITPVYDESGAVAEYSAKQPQNYQYPKMHFQ